VAHRVVITYAIPIVSQHNRQHIFGCAAKNTSNPTTNRFSESYRDQEWQRSSLPNLWTAKTSVATPDHDNSQRTNKFRLSSSEIS